MYSPNAYDYDISEREMGLWTKDEYGIPYFVPTPARDAAVVDLFERAGMADALYQVGEREILERADEARFLRSYGLGSWLSAMPRRFPLRVDFPLDGRAN